MRLLEIYKKINEQNDGNVVEFPRQNLYVSFDEQQKKIFFSPIQGGSHSSKTRTFVNMLKQNFRITSVQPKEKGSFEVIVDPRENFGLVKDYITQTVDKEI